MPNRTLHLTSRPRSLRPLCALLACLTVSPLLQAQSTGAVSGRVVDRSTGLALAGARVTVAGVEAYTNASGDFHLPGVPAGSHQAEISYVGYSALQRPVAVTAGSPARLEVVFNDEVVRLETMVIEGTAVGSARAINQQRAAATLTTIVAADEIGRFPDQNAAEAMQRLPGVSLYRDQGEGRFINLRGLNYIYTAVNMNGTTVASPELGDRASALDVVAADAITAIDVTKVPTPDMSAEGLGGSVNIRTKSPFDGTGREGSVTLQGVYTRLTDKFDQKIGAHYADVNAAGTVGYSAGFSWQERNFGSQNFEHDGWSLRQVNASSPLFYVPDALGFRDYVINRERTSVTAAVELRPADDTLVYLRAAHSRFTDTEDRHVFYVPFSRGTLLSADGTSAAFDNISRVRRDLRIRQKDQKLTALTAGFERTAGAWQLDGQAGWSKGRETRPDETAVRFRRNTSDSDLRFTFTGLYDITLEQTAGAAVGDPASYTTLDRLEVQNNFGNEVEKNAALNARYNVPGTSSFLKGGLALRRKDKDSDVNIARYSAPASFTFASVAGSVNPDYPFGLRVPRINHESIKAAFTNNRAAFTATALEPDSTLDDWKTAETVSSAYLMGGTSSGRAHLLAGVRYEGTQFRTRGYQFRSGVITPTAAGRDYDNLLPGAHLRYDFGSQLVGRVSYSQSLVRPAFGETAIFRNVADTDTEVTSGNPALETLESRNWDASLEYYLPSLGVVSAAVFHKQIDNFSYSITVPGGDPVFPTYDLVTFANGSDGTVQGVELAYSQQFRFLPGPLAGLGFMANATFVDSEATYPTRPGEKLPFIGQSNVTGNAALTYERRGLFLRLALNWRDAHLREDEPIGAAADEDVYIDDYYQLDLTGSYRLRENLELFTEFTNLTNQPFRVYLNSSNGQGRRLGQIEQYDWTANFGLRMKF